MQPHKELGAASAAKSEKGIRCKSGTMPVAVILIRKDYLSQSLPLVQTGKARQEGISQKTCLCEMDFDLQAYGFAINVFSRQGKTLFSIYACMYHFMLSENGFESISCRVLYEDAAFLLT